MSRKRKRLDSNHHALVRELRQLGWLVMSTSGLGGGFPDLVIARPFQHTEDGEAPSVRLIEIKTATGTLTPHQQRFTADGWPVTVVRSLDDLA